MRLFLLAILLCLSANALSQDWAPQHFDVVVGTLVARDDGIIAAANDDGQIVLAASVSGIDLRPDQRVAFEFGDSIPQTIYLFWQRADSAEVLQHAFQPQGGPSAYVDMGTVPGWQGPVELLEFGFIMLPGEQVTVHGVRVLEPKLADHIEQALDSWLFFAPWASSSINVYTGTRSPWERPYPLPFFVGVVCVLLVGYLLFARSRRTLSAAACIVFAGWVVLDAFWQKRLYAQLAFTVDRYGGLSSSEKEIASPYSKLARFARDSRRLMTGDEAKVFVASEIDVAAMQASYYLAPINTYWHRLGDELPDANFLRPGDFVMVLLPSKISYNRGAGKIRYGDGAAIPVTERLASELGVLLEVAQ